MNIAWISPSGAGREIVQKLLQTEHTVIAYGEDVGVPSIEKKVLAPVCRNADLVVVDGTFPLKDTKRSFRPADVSLFLDELRRKHRVVALGPTPTIDLLVQDARYFTKWCRRLGIPHARKIHEGEAWTSGAWFVGNEVIPPGPFLEPWKPIFKSVGFRGWFELYGMGETVLTCSADWTDAPVPPDQVAEFLVAMATR